jgi:DNA-binding transcriptional MerR regulator
VDGAEAIKTLTRGREGEGAVDGARQQLFGISELAEEFDISTRTIRFYESKELLQPQRVNGSRVYTRRERARLALILRAKAIGSTLADIKQYLDLYGEHGEGRAEQLDFVINNTRIAIAELEERKSHIEKMMADLQMILSESERNRRRLARKAKK